MPNPFGLIPVLPRLLRTLFAAAITLTAIHAVPEDTTEPPSKAKILATMRRATAFMVEKVGTNGGYVWTYLPDLSRRWGELEAKPTMIWLQPPGTGSMGHLFLDAYHATGDEYYYQAAEGVAAALIWAQHPSGGWNYVADFAGERSLREWYETVGRNAWRLEEFQHYYGNATFDDGGTAESSKFLLRLYIEKRDPKYRPALEKALRFVLDSQYPIGGWPQRFPLMYEFSHHGRPDYTSFITLNDDVASENIDFLIKCYQSLGDRSLIEPITRAMNCFVVTQMGPPQPGWALQYTLDLKPAGARTYEPIGLATHTTAASIEQLLQFYRLTGESKFIARIPEALDWLDRSRCPKDLVSEGRTHPTFLELGTNLPIYIHRRGSNVFNGEYYTDREPQHTVGHYNSFRVIDVTGLRALYEKTKATPVAELTKDSPLISPAPAPLPRYFTVNNPDFSWLGNRSGRPENGQQRAGRLISSLNAEGYWPSPLHYTSHPYAHDGEKGPVAGDYSQARVGDDTDTSPYPDPTPKTGISTGTYIRNMGVLIEALEQAK
jgi:PelA/Pel-15E family pectate lyase